MGSSLLHFSQAVFPAFHSAGRRAQNATRNVERAALLPSPPGCSHVFPLPSTTLGPEMLLEIASAVDFFSKNRHYIQRCSQQQLRLVRWGVQDMRHNDELVAASKLIKIA